MIGGLFLTPDAGRKMITFVNTKKASKTVHVLSEMFRIILNPSSVKKRSNIWQCQEFKTKRPCDAKNDTVTQKTSKVKTRAPATSKSLKAKAGPTAMKKMLKKNVLKAIIYETKPRLAARGRSQTNASERCKKI